MAVDPRDEPIPHHRVAWVRSEPRDGQPYWLTIIRADGGAPQYRWDLRFVTESQALAAANALLQTGTAWMVFVNKETRVMGRGI